jgi:two-component system nitrogen regulation response regulator GlnG
LDVFAIKLPALRDRTDDIPILAEHFIKLFNRQLGKDVRSIAPDAMHTLVQYDWPGNVRELQSAIKHAFVRSAGKVLMEVSLPTRCGGPFHTPDSPASSPLDVDGIREYVRSLLAEDSLDIYQKLHSEIDRILLPEVLDHVGGNQAQASEVLGIARSTLRIKLNDLGLRFEKRVKPESGRED